MDPVAVSQADERGWPIGPQSSGQLVPVLQDSVGQRAGGGGLRERCHTEVKKEHRTQWFFKITEYAQRLLDGLRAFSGRKKPRKSKPTGSGKSTGARSCLRSRDGYRPARLPPPGWIRYSASHLSCSPPEREAVMDLVTPEQRDEVARYIEQAKKVSEIERFLSTVRERTGVFTGAHAVNPANGEEILIYVADYVLDTYGDRLRHGGTSP